MVSRERGKTRYVGMILMLPGVGVSSPGGFMIWTAYICEVNFMENDFVRWLDGCCSGIASLEAEGGARRVAGDVEAFRDVMHEKAMVLAGMAREGEPHIVALPERMREKARLRLARFTASAENALALDSVFYMSALLFPDEYRDGEPNDLELFRDEIRNQLQAEA